MLSEIIEFGNLCDFETDLLRFFEGEEYDGECDDDVLGCAG